MSRARKETAVSIIIGNSDNQTLKRWVGFGIRQQKCMRMKQLPLPGISSVGLERRPYKPCFRRGSSPRFPISQSKTVKRKPPRNGEGNVVTGCPYGVAGEAQLAFWHDGEGSSPSADVGLKVYLDSRFLRKIGCRWTLNMLR